MTEREAIIELATLLAGVIQRMGAAYGSPENWRQDFTRAVKVFEAMSRPT